MEQKWEPILERDYRGYALFHFNADEVPNCLKTIPGDKVILLKECALWYYGYIVGFREKAGIIPKSYVHIPTELVELSIVNLRAHDLFIQISSRIKKYYKSALHEYSNLNNDTYNASLLLINDLISYKRDLASDLLLNPHSPKLTEIFDIIEKLNSLLNVDRLVFNQSSIIGFEEFNTFRIFDMYKKMPESFEKYHGNNENTIMFNFDSELQDTGDVDNDSIMNTPNIHVKFEQPPDLKIENNPFEFHFILCAAGTPLEYLTDKVGLGFYNNAFIAHANKIKNSISFLFYELNSSDMYRKLTLISYGYRVSQKSVDNKKQTYKRLFCAAAITMGELFTGETRKLDFNLNYYTVPANENKNIEEYLLNRAAKPAGINFKVEISVLYGTLATLRRNNSSIFDDGLIPVKPAKFPEIINAESTKNRNDLYVDLNEAFVDKSPKGTKLSLYITAQVFDSTGVLQKDCIYPVSNFGPKPSFDSNVILHSTNPYFSDKFKIFLPKDMMEKCHIRFLYHHVHSKDKVEKISEPFAFSVLKLNSKLNTIVKDGEHKIAIYKIEGSLHTSATHYLRLSYDYNGAQDQNPSDSSNLIQTNYLKIDTRLVSTWLTTNYSIQELKRFHSKSNNINWDNIFEELLYVSNLELLQFSNDIIFSIIKFLENKEIDSTKPLQIIIKTLVMLSNKKRLTSQNLFYERCKTLVAPKFNCIFYDCLIQKTKTLKEDSSRDMIKQTLKALSLITTLMTFSLDKNNFKNAQRQKEVVRPGLSVNVIIYKIFESLCKNLKEKKENLLSLKIEILITFPQLIVEKQDLFSVDQLVDIMNLIFDNIFDSKDADFAYLNKIYRFAETFLCDMIKNVIHFDIDHLLRITPNIIKQVELISKLMKSVNVYLKPLGYIIDILEVYNFDDASEKLFEIKTHVMKTIYNYMEFKNYYTVTDFIQNNTIIPIFVSFLRIVHKQEFIKYHLTLSDEDRIKKILIILKVSHLVLSQNCIPSEHLTLQIISCNVISNLLSYCSELLYLNDSILYNKKVCEKFFEIGLKLLKHKAMDIETFYGELRERYLRKFGDSRIQVIETLSKLWKNLKDKRREFYDEFLKKFIQITMVDNQEVCKCAFDLIIKTFVWNSDDKKEIKLVEGIVIDSFDFYASTCPDLNKYIILLNEVVVKNGKSLTKPPKFELYNSITSEVISTLKQLANFGYAKEESENTNILVDICIHKIALFYKSIGKVELFVRNMNKLAQRKISSKDYLEAAYCFLEKANILQWSRKMLPETEIYPKEPEYVRKTNILKKSVGLLIKVNYFGKCIQIYDEIYDIYNKVFMNYHFISNILSDLSQLYTDANDEIRYDPNYFLVGFYGQLFHKSLKNQDFIFRGKNFLQLGDLINLLKKNFPQAEVTGSAKKITDNVKNSLKQVIFCTGVTTVYEKNEIMDNSFVHDKVKSYYKLNDVNKFRRQRVLVNTEDVRNKWVEDIVYTSEFIFPGSLEWAHVTESVVTQLSPIQIAISDVSKKTESLKETIKSIRINPEMNLTSLASLLNGIIDAAVNGGTSMYGEAFTSKEYLAENPDDENLVKELKTELVTQVNYTKIGLSLHEKYMNENYVGLHNKMVTMFDDVRLKMIKYCGEDIEKYIPSSQQDMKSLDEYSLYANNTTGSDLNDLVDTDEKGSENSYYEKSNGKYKTIIPFENVEEEKNMNSTRKSTKEGSLSRSDRLNSKKKDGKHTENKTRASSIIGTYKLLASNDRKTEETTSQTTIDRRTGNMSKSESHYNKSGTLARVKSKSKFRK